MTLLQDQWEAALINLYEDEYIFVTVAPRTGEDWASDVVAAMMRRTSDPRGWKSHDWDLEDEASSSDFPFREFQPAEVRAHLFPVNRNSAERQLVAMADEWFTPSNILDYSTKGGEFASESAILLSRFGDSACYYSSSVDARKNNDPDFRQSISAGHSFTDLLIDLGLVVVSDAEVGVFWRFNAY